MRDKVREKFLLSVIDDRDREIRFLREANDRLHEKISPKVNPKQDDPCALAEELNIKELKIKIMQADIVYNRLISGAAEPNMTYRGNE